MHGRLGRCRGLCMARTVLLSRSILLCSKPMVDVRMFQPATPISYQKVKRSSASDQPDTCAGHRVSRTHPHGHVEQHMVQEGLEVGQQTQPHSQRVGEPEIHVGVGFGECDAAL